MIDKWNSTARLVASFSSFIITAALSLTAFAQGGRGSTAAELAELSLEELSEVRILTSTASKKEEDISRAPGVITVLSRKDIEDYGARDFRDLLLRLPNVYTWGTSILSGNVASIRGQTLTQIDNHVLILLNGRPVRDNHAGGHHEPIYQSFPLEAIERIELIRGPGSVLYGTNAFSGVINIITGPPSDNTISVGYGSDQTVVTSGAYQKKFGDLDVMIAARLFDTGGWKFSAVDELGVSGSADYERDNLGIFGHASFKNLTLQGHVAHQDMTALGARPRFPVLEDVLELNRHFVDAGYDIGLPGQWGSTLNATFNGFKLINVANLETKYDDYYVEYAASGPATDNIDLLLGVRYEDLNGDLNDETTAYSERRFGFYAQADYEPFNSLKLTAGFQVNKVPGQSYAVSPRFAAIWSLHNNLGLKLLYGEAFRSATAAEQVIDVPTVVGNPNLGPETISTVDVQLFYTTARVYSALTYYHSIQRDTIARVPVLGSRASFANTGRVKFEGIELEAEVEVSDQIDFVMSLTHQVSEQNGISDVGFVPNTMAKFGLNYSPWERFRLGAFASHFSEAASFPTAPQRNPDADSHTWMTLKASMDFSASGKRPAIGLDLFVENLLDEDVYFPEINFRQVNTLPLRPGRGVYATATVKF